MTRSAAPLPAGRRALRTLVQRATLPALALVGYAVALALLCDVVWRVF